MALHGLHAYCSHLIECTSYFAQLALSSFAAQIAPRSLQQLVLLNASFGAHIGNPCVRHRMRVLLVPYLGSA
eukprot:5497045-Pyramimonas_sp.AAC.1